MAGPTTWGRILFLDLGRVTGFARGAAEDLKPENGIIILGREGSTSQQRFGVLLLWLLDELRGPRRPRMVCYESPIAHLAMKQSAATKRVLLGYHAVVEAAAEVMKIPEIREATAIDIRRNLLARNLKKGENPKAVVIGALSMLGHNVEDHNAADAVAGFLYSTTMTSGDAGIKATPLFAGDPSE